MQAAKAAGRRRTAAHVPAHPAERDRAGARLATITLGSFVAAEATLTFLGVGLQPPDRLVGHRHLAARRLLPAGTRSLLLFPCWSCWSAPCSPSSCWATRSATPSTRSCGEAP